jgi:hypothetical protein
LAPGLAERTQILEAFHSVVIPCETLTEEWHGSETHPDFFKKFNQA